MSEKFDPYYQWLGIPAGEQPPHHYRLLGITPLEESPTVIENAADQRMAHLRNFQAGQHSTLSQKLLNELAAAKLCLLNPQKKTAYDQALRQELRPSGGQAGRGEADVLDLEFATVSATRRTSTAAVTSADQGKKSPLNQRVLIAAAALAVAAIGSAGLWWAMGHGGAPGEGEIAKATDPATSAEPVKEPVRKPPEPAAKDSTKKPQPDVEKTPAKKPVTDAEKTPAKKPETDEEKTPVKKPETDEEKTPAKKPEADEEPAPPKKLVPPSADEQKRLVSEVDEVYKSDAAKGRAAKVALARKLLEDGRKNEANRAEQFVLLRRAGEIARDAGEAELMLEAVDAIVTAGFDIRPYQVKSRLLQRLVEQGAAGGDVPLAAAHACCMKFAEEAAANGAMEEASAVLDAAKKSLPKSLARAQTAQRLAKAAIARARTPAEKAERERKAGEAQRELDGLKSAQSALAECAKGLQQAQRENEALAAAREKLKTAPGDPEACLAVGRWHCFVQGDWDEGLKLLAKGSDEALKSLAAEELAAKPAKADDKVARGDAWWDLAEKAKGKAKAAMHGRAAHWYQEALPDLAPGLGKARVEKRLAQAANEPAQTDDRSARVRPPPAVAPFNETTAKQHQARWAKFLRAPVVQTNSIGMKLVLIPPGEFMMGSPGNVPGEGPQHLVRITRPFWLGATVVTQEEYQRVTGGNPSKFQGEPKRPVEQVSWDDAVEFCRTLSKSLDERMAKRRYALPTEAQWEYACRAGNDGPWYFSAQPNPLPVAVEANRLGEHAWFDMNAPDGTHVVAQRRANAWGLYDMYGNVAQWCQDWSEQDYYAKSPTDDPQGPPGGTSRMVRSGGWRDIALTCRSARRFADSPARRTSDVGFRVCLVLLGK